MVDWLYSLDVALFLFLNRSLATPLGDMLWPLITDYDKQFFMRIALVVVWLWLLVKGGTRGRTAALLLVPLLFISDQLSSTVIKPLVGRVRPCHALPLDQMHLLVGCGGLSFPSSHAVNNFGVATMFSLYYPKARAALYAWASLVALSRVFVGVHYPSDVVGGAIIGTFVGWCVVVVWQQLALRFFPSLVIARREA
ncbi:MAG: phosphatase PAP2 family protein [Ignavibacteria bacterium]